MTRWEHKTVKVNSSGFFTTTLSAEDLDEILNSLGKLGWELVSAVPVTSNGYTKFIAATLKRPVTY